LSLALGSSSFLIDSNGFADGPAQALRDFLIARRAAKLTVVLHPLLPEEGAHHEISTYRFGELTRQRRIRLPSRPPITYPFDLMVPPLPPAADVWFGFNCLAASVGLTARRFGRVGKVVYWCVDYVDDRFGSSPLTAAYEALDGLCCRRVDARFELSEAALVARSRRHQRNGHALAPSSVVPMGAWTERVPTNTEEESFNARKVVFMGHMVPTQGVRALMEALVLLHDRGVAFTADFVGRGPELPELQRAAAAGGLADTVTFHGFVEKFTDIEKILAGGTVALAPYDPNAESFKRFADPGKIKAYLAAGLPIVTTRVAPNAESLEKDGCARLVDFSPGEIASGIQAVLDSREVFNAMRAAALEASKSFDWNRIMERAFGFLGIALT